MHNLKTFLAWLWITNAAQMPQSKFKAGLGVIFLSKKSLTFMIPIYTVTI